MSLINTYSIKKDIIIALCSDNYVRVLKKHYNNRFAIESLYAISKTQSIVLLLFTQANTVENATDLMSRLYNIDITLARNIVLTIIDRYSGLLEIEQVDENGFEATIDFKEIKRIMTSQVLSPNTLPVRIKRKDIPESVVVFISDSCLCNCIYCRVDAGVKKCSPEYMQLSLITKIASECNKLGISDVELTGGDPLIHPDFVEILNIFNDNNVSVAFSTKCPIAERKLEKIKNANISMLQISLDTIDADMFAKLTGTSVQYFERLYNTIISAINLAFCVRIKSVITKININSLVTMMEILYGKGVKSFVVQQLSCGDRLFSDDLMPTIDEYIKLDNEINILLDKYSDIEIEKAYSIEMLFSSRAQKKYFRQDCMAGMSGIVIQVDGSYAYCGQSFNKELRFLNVERVDILSAWNSNELKHLVFPQKENFVNTRCYECDDFDRCSMKRCYIRTYNKFGTIYEVDPLCPHYPE